MQDDLTRALVKRLDTIPEHRLEGKDAFDYFVPESEINEEGEL